LLLLPPLLLLMQWSGHLISNFIYSPARSTTGFVTWLIARDIHTATSVSRNFFWTDVNMVRRFGCLAAVAVQLAVQCFVCNGLPACKLHNPSAANEVAGQTSAWCAAADGVLQLLVQCCVGDDGKGRE
jgi:hypothetical protein